MGHNMFFLIYYMDYKGSHQMRNIGISFIAFNFCQNESLIHRLYTNSNNYTFFCFTFVAKLSTLYHQVQPYYFKEGDSRLLTLCKVHSVLCVRVCVCMFKLVHSNAHFFCRGHRVSRLICPIFGLQPQGEYWCLYRVHCSRCYSPEACTDKAAEGCWK